MKNIPEEYRRHLRLDIFKMLPLETRRRLVSAVEGQRVDSLLFTVLRPLDIVRLADDAGYRWLIEMVNPQKKLVYILQIPPERLMKNWEGVVDWGLCRLGSMGVGEGDDLLLYYEGPGGEEKIRAILRLQVIDILEKREKPLPITTPRPRKKKARKQ